MTDWGGGRPQPWKGARVQIADVRRGLEASNAPDVTVEDTEQPKPESGSTTTPSSDTTPVTPTSTSSGDGPGRNEQDDEAQSSRQSERPSRRLRRPWRAPNTAMDFAAQANQVATMILNDEMDLDKARVYSAVARTVAQAMSTEVTRSRALEQRPYLSLDPSGVYEEEDEEELEDPDE